jgi:predicted PurR-regulated permease PerM
MVDQERPGWRSRDILRAVAIVAGFYIALQLLWVGRSILLLAFLGVLFGLALTAGVDWLQRKRIPRGLGAILLVLTFFGILGGLGAATAPSITGQLRELRTQLPQAIKKIQTWVHDRQEGVSQVLEQVAPDAAAPGQGAKPAEGAERQQPQTKPDEQAQGEGEQKPGGGIADQLGGVGRFAFGFFSSTLAALAGFILILFVAIFVAVDASTYHKGLMHLFPHRARPRAGEVLSSTATMLRRWLLTQFVAMIAVGTLTAVVLLLLDVKAAIGLGIIAGILEFVPIAGPIIAAIPGVMVPIKMLYVQDVVGDQVALPGDDKNTENSQD